MNSIFLSHTSIDKPFVEKLAKDLNRLGLKVWYDSWEIKVGESIMWKVEEGINNCDYIAIVLSEEALKSEWVKTELASAMTLRMRLKKGIVLPILYRNCEIPVLLQDTKYADFRTDYNKGLNEILSVFNIKNVESITSDNWRYFTRSKNEQWKKFREQEYSELVTRLCDLAYEYNWSVWTGGTKNKYSITLSAWIDRDKKSSISIKMIASEAYRYKASFINEINPNNIPNSEYTEEVGNTVNQVEEYVWKHIEKFTNENGKPTEKAHYFTYKNFKGSNSLELYTKIKKELYWYQGDKILTMN